MQSGSGGFRGHGRHDVYADLRGWGITTRSIITASLTEVKTPQGASHDYPHLGDADLTVQNIVPEESTGRVWFRCHIDWPSDLDLRISWIIA